MFRVPNTGAKELERLALIRRFERLLNEIERIPEHRRENECADVRAEVCRRMLEELGAPGPVQSAAPPAAPVTGVVDIDQLISEFSRK